MRLLENNFYSYMSFVYLKTQIRPVFEIHKPTGLPKVNMQCENFWCHYQKPTLEH